MSSLSLTLAIAKCHSGHVSEVSSPTVMVINGGIDTTEKEGPAGGSEEHNANELAAAHTGAPFAKFITVAHCVYMSQLFSL